MSSDETRQLEALRREIEEEKRRSDYWYQSYLQQLINQIDAHIRATRGT